MKTTPNRIGKLIGSLVLGGCLSVPMMLSAQVPDPRPGPPPPPNEGRSPQNGMQPERMKRVMGRIEALRRAGKNDEANQLQMRMRSAMMRQRMGRQEWPQWSGPQGMGPQGMGPQRMRMRGMGMQPQMARPGDWMNPERKPKLEGQRRSDAVPGQPLPPRAKIEHLKQAAEHLQAAGYGEYADKARKEIGRLEEQARREAGPADANAGLKEEMNKLRREIEELRQQNRRLKEAAAPKRDQARPEEPREPMHRPNADGAPKHDPAPPHPEIQ